MGTVHAVVIAFAIVVGAGPQLHAEPPTRFAKALQSAEANEATSDGAVFDGTIARQFGQRHADTMDRCANDATADNLAKFNLVMRLDVAGHVVEALVYPETSVAKCLREAVSHDSYEKPAHADYWVRISMSIKP